MHILAVKPVFCLGVTINVIGKTGSILGYKMGCFEFFFTSWIIILCLILLSGLIVKFQRI